MGITPCFCDQDIASAEEESAKKKVGAATAVKQLEKLKKEAARTEADAAKAETELAARKDEHKVLSCSLLSNSAQMCLSPAHRCFCILAHFICKYL